MEVDEDTTITTAIQEHIAIARYLPDSNFYEIFCYLSSQNLILGKNIKGIQPISVSTKVCNTKLNGIHEPQYVSNIIPSRLVSTEKFKELPAATAYINASDIYDILCDVYAQALLYEPVKYSTRGYDDDALLDI